jgi:hypothetical protein
MWQAVLVGFGVLVPALMFGLGQGFGEAIGESLGIMLLVAIGFAN